MRKVSITERILQIFGITIIIAIMSLFVVYFARVINTNNGKFYDHDAYNYESRVGEMIGAEGFIPSLSELSSPEDIRFKYYRESDILLFETNISKQILNITAVYNEEAYQAEKQKINEKYDFMITPPMKDRDKILPDVSWTYKYNSREYFIQLVDFDWDYNHEFGMIATCDQYYEISYLMYYDKGVLDNYYLYGMNHLFYDFYNLHDN